MKLRTNKNSIRLRLSQSELRRFGEHGYVEEIVQLTPGIDGALKYSLEISEIDDIRVSYMANHIKIKVPAKQAEIWVATDLVGLETKIPISDNEELFVLLEKDFKCLVERPYEDETDNFPNPLAGFKC